MNEKKSKQRMEDENILWGFFTECASIPNFWSWWKKVYPRIEHIRYGYKIKCNYSVITFVLTEFSNGTTAKKVAIGGRVEVLGDVLEVDFWYLLRNICREGYEKLLQFKDDAVYLGIGVECMEGDSKPIWNFYVGDNECNIHAVKCRNRKLLEYKKYTYKKKEDTMIATGRFTRIQVNTELDDNNSKKMLDWLKEAGYIDKIYQTAKVLTEHLSLDTISVSPVKVSLYFE